MNATLFTGLLIGVMKRENIVLLTSYSLKIDFTDLQVQTFSFTDDIT